MVQKKTKNLRKKAFINRKEKKKLSCLCISKLPWIVENVDIFGFQFQFFCSFKEKKNIHSHKNLQRFWDKSKKKIYKSYISGNTNKPV